MRDKHAGTGSRLLRAFAVVVVLVSCVVGPAPGISAAFASRTSPESASRATFTPSRGGEISVLMMKIPDGPVTSGDADLPAAPAK